MNFVKLRKIFYSTQQGTSRDVAQKIHEKTGIDFADISELKTSDFDLYSTIIFVTATYGRGDCPESAKPFWEYLQQRDPSKKLSLKFAVFGCGSSNFARTFVGFAKKLEAALLERGAQEIAELGIKDENEEKSSDFDAWVNSLQF